MGTILHLNLSDIARTLTGPAQAILRPIYPGAKHPLFDLSLEAHGQFLHTTPIFVPRADFPTKGAVARLHFIGQTWKIHADGSMSLQQEPELFSAASFERALKGALEPLSLGGQMRLFEGDLPARTSAPTVGALLLASMELGEPGKKPFTIEDGEAIFRQIEPARVQATGIVGFYRLVGALTGECINQGIASRPEEGGTLVFEELAFEAGGLVGVDRFTISFEDNPP